MFKITLQKTTIYYGTESIIYVRPKLRDITSDEMKQMNSLSCFEGYVKMWVPVNCPCRLGKVYVDGVGFIITV